MAVCSVSKNNFNSQVQPYGFFIDSNGQRFYARNASGSLQGATIPFDINKKYVVAGQWKANGEVEIRDATNSHIKSGADATAYDHISLIIGPATTYFLFISKGIVAPCSEPLAFLA